MAIDGNTSRRETIIEKRERLSIESEYAAFKEIKKLERGIIESCKGTEYEEAVSEIMRILDSAATPKDRYLSSLRLFGKNDGVKIYRLIKEAV